MTPNPAGPDDPSVRPPSARDDELELWPARRIGWAASGWGTDRASPDAGTSLGAPTGVPLAALESPVPAWCVATDAALDRLYETGGAPWIALNPVDQPETPGPPHGTRSAPVPRGEPRRERGEPVGEARVRGSGAGFLHAIAPPDRQACDIAMVFVTAGFHGDYGHIIDRVRRELRASHLVGCSATHGIAGGHVLEGRETVTVLAVTAPGSSVRSVALSPEVLERAVGLAAFPDRQAEYLHRATGVLPADVNGWVLLADHASVEAPSVAAMWTAAWPGTTMIGAIASTAGRADAADRATALFHGGDVIPDGVVGLAIGGDWTIEAVSSQGCASIGRPWTITEVDGEHAIRRIGRQPALDVLLETVRALPPLLVERARGNLFAGLAVDEVHMTSSGAAPPVVSCAVLGADQDSGSLLVLGRPVVGQTVQFQYRDAAAATNDLESQLRGTRTHTEGRAPLAAIVLADDARHAGFFGALNRDASTVRTVVGASALAGFGCRAELGPVGAAGRRRSVAMTHATCVGLLVPAGRPGDGATTTDDVARG